VFGENTLLVNTQRCIARGVVDYDEIIIFGFRIQNDRIQRRLQFLGIVARHANEGGFFHALVN
jgi:hypothetical protein